MPKAILNLFLQHYTNIPTTIGGVNNAGRALVLAAIFTQSDNAILCVTASRAEADKLVDDLLAFETPAALFPESDMAIFNQGESDPERLRTLHRLEQDERLIVVAPLLALLQPVPKKGTVRRRILKTGEKIDYSEIEQTLKEWGYREEDLVTAPGQFARRDRIFDLYPSNAQPLRLRRDETGAVEMFSFATSTQRNEESLDSSVILPMEEPDGDGNLLDYFPSQASAVLVGPEEIKERLCLMSEATDDGWRYSAFREVGLLKDGPDDWDQIKVLFSAHKLYEVGREKGDLQLETEALETFETLDEFKQWVEDAEPPVFVVTSQPKRLSGALKRRGFKGIEVKKGRLSSGFSIPGLLSLVTDHEIYGSTRRLRYEAPRPTAPLLDFGKGDLVIHEERGIGRFLGMDALNLEGSTRDLLRFEYAAEQTLSVPPDQIDKIAPFKGLEVDEPALSRLHTDAWQNSVSKSLASILETAKKLKSSASKSQKLKAPALKIDDEAMDEFAAAFPYEETPSQKRAIEQIAEDLEREFAMQRLLCGDVGFGKTEVALRAFYQALVAGHQVALLAPTTVLARQHFESFLERMRPFGIRVAGLWGGCEKEEEIVAELADGSLSAVVGTHRLLSQDVSFHNLGLLIIDEEQSFGVTHKERITELSKGVHQLSLTATPIPRTTQLALAGVRDISLLDAPPLARRPVRTYLLEEQDKFIAAALMRELERDGQAFLLHNRVDEIAGEAERVERLVPGARVAQAHGQMEDDQLAQIIEQFLEGRYDVLVCTTIIESGIDFPRVNTIIIKDAQQFGLSQLYQIRGRVGRSHQQAYCYLLTPQGEALTEKARRRLDAIQGLQGLGGGYQVALSDLEIRGAGDLLGEEQSGHIGKLGYAFYSKLLERALGEKKSEVQSAPSFVYGPPLDAHIPQSYVAPDSVRVSIYRNLSQCKSRDEVDRLAEQLEERFGEPPSALTNLLELHLLALTAASKGITAIEERKSFGTREIVLIAGEEERTVFEKPPQGAALLSYLAEVLQTGS